MFKSLFQPQKSEPAFDPAMGDRLAKAILDETKQGKFNTILTKVDALRQGQWDERAFYIGLVGSTLEDPKKLSILPDNALGNTIKGSAAINFAWKIRGSSTADKVEEANWNPFFENLDFAGKCLLRAAEQDTEDPTSMAWLQTIAMGLSLEKDVASTWFNEAIRRDPVNQQAHRRRLTYLCEKWSGSHQEMFDFAHDTMKRIPEDSPLQCIIYQAFQEYYLYLRSFDKDLDRSRALLRNKKTREESIMIYQNAMQKHQIKKISDYWPHNLTAFWFFIINIPEFVHDETKKIGPYFTQDPWSIFYKDPAQAYQKALNIHVPPANGI